MPQVIETHPRLEDGTPFPTLWWLTCRRLSSQVGRLESSGWMATLNERLTSERAFHAALVKSTRAYLESRDRLEQLQGGGHPGGGPDRIKCMHAHTDHHLITGDNPAGEEVLRPLASVEPKSHCV